MSLKTQIAEDMKSAMRAKDAPRLAAIRLLMAGVKQREVDERIELDDVAITAVVEKQIKQRRDAITDAGLTHFQAAYPAPGEGDRITKEDLFYYIYGILHSPDYLDRFADNLSKELPRIPAVKTAQDFWAFSKAGRALGDLHVNYEVVEPYAAAIDVRHAGQKGEAAPTRGRTCKLTIQGHRADAVGDRARGLPW
jgi:hypothetical protein